ncbi:hypothetical protein CMUS01_01180 [Colletotrichum musicola]|uniref:Uncharacterized protein n=1 Tax=Colletotrichum musicola TaxID=2175873 RepID=A0A8H6U8X4_9PEZI|nr:hypothetical protein CMUS01_01180 [Colletotrichum musicola]
MPTRPANNGRAAQPVSARQPARRRVSVSTPALHLTGAPPQAVGTGEADSTCNGTYHAGATFIALRPATPANPVDEILRVPGPIANDHTDLPMAPA